MSGDDLVEVDLPFVCSPWHCVELGITTHHIFCIHSIVILYITTKTPLASPSSDVNPPGISPIDTEARTIT